jgi:putative addiction module killer protein
VITILRTHVFDDWLAGLRDRQARARIQDRLALGNPGDVRPVGQGVSELRIDHGPGYRVYLAQRGPVLVLLLCGGDKSSQPADIRRAIAMAASLPADLGSDPDA